MAEQACVVTGCRMPVDPSAMVQRRITVSPYVVWSYACRAHLVRLTAIGLPVRPIEVSEDQATECGGQSQAPDVSQSNATARKPVGYVAFDPSNIDLRGFGYVPPDTNAIFPSVDEARAAVEDYDGPASVYALVPVDEEEGTGQ